METEPSGNAAITFEEIKIERKIGQGTFGKVYEATFRGHKIALKKCRLEDASIWQEVEALTKTKHKHIIKFISTTTDHKNNKILVMEYMSDGSLADLLQQPNIKLDMKEKLRIAIDIAKGLKYLHELQPKIIHRDLKPDNILLFDAKKRAKITDFGCARVLQKTKTETSVGTLGYLAPEVAQEKPHNEKADIFSFGVLLYSIFLNANKALALDEEERQKQIKSLPDGCFKDLILKCCNKDPAMRPTASDCVRDLKSEFYKKETPITTTISSPLGAAMVEANIAVSAALKKELEIKEKYPIGTIFLYNEPGKEYLLALLRWITPPNVGSFVLLDVDLGNEGYIVLRQTDLSLGRLPTTSYGTVVLHDMINTHGVNNYFIPVACLSSDTVRRIKMKICRSVLEDEE